MTQQTAANLDRADLLKALQLERHSMAMATAAMTHDDTPVFEHLASSAARHIAKLTELLGSFGFDSPPPDSTDPVWESTQAALEAAFENEREKAQVYDLLITATEGTDLHRVFLNLWQAAEHRHQPAIAHHLSQAAVEKPQT